MKPKKFNVGSECVNITLQGVPVSGGFEWTVSAVNTANLTANDWNNLNNYIRELKGEIADDSNQ